jgi:RNA recognition motif-containing protein
MTRTLYVTNLSSETTEAELREMFAGVGDVLSVRIPIHPETRLQRDYAFVEMESLELVRAAADSLNHHILHDRKVQVSVVPLPEERNMVRRADLSPVKVKSPSRRTGRPRSR